MRFTPKTEEQIQEERKFKLLTPGEADFEVIKAEDTTSSKGSDMIKLTLRVWDSAGDDATVFAYLLESMPHLLRHFAYATGLGHAYEAGELDAAECEGARGRCLIKIEPGKPDPKGGKYPDRNVIEDFVVSDRTKNTANYQQSKTGGAGAVAIERAKKSAIDEFGKKAPAGTSASDKNAMWAKAMRSWFGDGKPDTEAQWLSFAEALRDQYVWGTGFRPAEQVAGAVPDDDIPF